MGSLGYFELMAECSVALGGFAAVHAALRGSTGPRGTFRAWGTVAFAFTALAMALVPVLFSVRGDLSSGDWQSIHGIGAALSVWCLATNLWFDVRLNAVGEVAQMGATLRTSQALPLMGSLLLLLALLGWPVAAGPLPYALAVLAPFLAGLLGIVTSFWLAMRDAIELAEKG